MVLLPGSFQLVHALCTCLGGYQNAHSLGHMHCGGAACVGVNLACGCAALCGYRQRECVCGVLCVFLGHSSLWGCVGRIGYFALGSLHHAVLFAACQQWHAVCTMSSCQPVPAQGMASILCFGAQSRGLPSGGCQLTQSCCNPSSAPLLSHFPNARLYNTTPLLWCTKCD